MDIVVTLVTGQTFSIVNTLALNLLLAIIIISKLILMMQLTTSIQKHPNLRTLTIHIVALLIVIVLRLHLHNHPILLLSLIIFVEGRMFIVDA